MIGVLKVFEMKSTIENMEFQLEEIPCHDTSTVEFILTSTTIQLQEHLFLQENVHDGKFGTLIQLRSCKCCYH